MTEPYILRSKKLLDSSEISDLFHALDRRYHIGDVQFHEEESFKKSGWDYSFTPMGDLSISDLTINKRTGSRNYEKKIIKII